MNLCIRDGDVCAACKRPFSTKRPNAKRMCRGPAAGIPLEIAVEVEKHAEANGVLLGDAIAALTKAVGIPPCGGCDKRRKWLNAAHQWVLDYFA